MKNYRLLIISILFSLLTFLYNWYQYNIEDFNLVLCIILFISIFVLFNIIFLKTLINIRNKKFIDILTLFILFIMIMINYNFNYKEIKLNVEWDKYYEKRKEVIKLVKDDKLGCIGDSNLAILPNNLKKVSQTGEIIIYKNDKYNQVIGFYIHRGIIDGDSDLIIYSNKDKSIIKEINIKKIKKIKNNWYYVTTGY